MFQQRKLKLCHNSYRCISKTRRDREKLKTDLHLAAKIQPRSAKKP